MGRPADRPDVFRAPTGILESLIYQASLRLPQPDLPGASGRNTETNLRVSVGAAGQLMMTPDPSGLGYTYSVQMTARPPEV